MRILVVGDDPLARGGIAVALERELEVVGHVAARDVPAAVEAFHPRVLVWDLGAGTGDVPPLPLDPPTLALCVDPTRAHAALQAGAKGAVLREIEAARIAAAARAVDVGLVALDPSFVGVTARPRPKVETAMTPREREVLELLAEGLSNKEIASRLNISDHTAKFHVTAIMDKLGAQSRTEAVVLGMKLGLVLL